jgi:hypothetical protein
MSAYRDSSGNTWKYHADISVDATSWTSGAIDITITIPNDWDAFWNYINQTDGRDIRVTDAAGTTLLSFDFVDSGASAVDTSDITARDGKIRIDAFTPTAAGTLRLQLYWGNGTVSSVFGVGLTISNAYTGYILTAMMPIRFAAFRERPDATKAAMRLHKLPTETLAVMVDISELLPYRRTPHARSVRAAEIKLATYAASSGGSNYGGMVAGSTVRFYGGRWILFNVASGASGTTYTVTPTITLTDGQVLNPSLRVTVQTLAE